LLVVHVDASLLGKLDELQPPLKLKTVGRHGGFLRRQIMQKQFFLLRKFPLLLFVLKDLVTSRIGACMVFKIPLARAKLRGKPGRSTLKESTQKCAQPPTLPQRQHACQESFHHHLCELALGLRPSPAAHLAQFFHGRLHHDSTSSKGLRERHLNCNILSALPTAWAVNQWPWIYTASMHGVTAALQMDIRSRASTLAAVRADAFPAPPASQQFTHSRACRCLQAIRP
jgi:hypothetical protein